VIDTEAENGAAAGGGGLAFSPVVAITIANNDVSAKLGAGGMLSIGGDFKANSSLIDTASTAARGETASDSTAIGVSIGVSYVTDTSTATTGRWLTAGGTAAFLSSVIAASETTTKASVAGAASNSAPNNSQDGGGNSADNKVSAQKSFAQTQCERSQRKRAAGQHRQRRS
jgi:hypothetical protein